MAANLPPRAVWLLAVNLFACRGGLPPPTFERFDPRVTPMAADHPDVGAVILLDRGLLTFGVDEERQAPFARLRRYRRIKVLRTSGIALGALRIPYEPRAVLRGLIVRTVQPNGDVITADTSDLQDVTDADGRRAKVLDVPGVAVGTIVEHAYDQYVDDLRFLAPWAFQGVYPTVRSEFAVMVPDGFDVDLRFSENAGFIDRPPERFALDGATRYSWSRSDLPPRFAEPNMPGVALLAPRAHVLYRGAQINGRRVRGFASWDDVVAWHLARTGDWDRLSAGTVAEAQRVAGDGSRAERALKLLELVARDLRGAGDAEPPLWRADMPHPEAVLRAKRGHPTTRGMLLVALLRAAGLPAVPGLFAYEDRDVLLPDLPTVRAVDGIAAVIPRPDRPLVLDPSQLTVSEAVAAPRLQGTRLILARADGAEVIRVPRSPPSASVCEIDIDARLGATGNIEGTLTARLTGAEAGELRRRLLDASADDYARLVSDFLHRRGAALTVESVTIADLRALSRPLSVTGPLRAVGAGKGDGPVLYLRLGQLIGWPTDRLRETRRSPLRLGWSRTVRIRGGLRLPEGFEPDVMPPPASHRYGDVSVEFGAQAEGRDRIRLVRTERWAVPAVSPRQYPAYHRFLRAVRASEDAAVGIRRPPERPLAY